jgi:hypothetical protein
MMTGSLTALDTIWVLARATPTVNEVFTSAARRAAEKAIRLSVPTSKVLD